MCRRRTNYIYKYDSYGYVYMYAIILVSYTTFESIIPGSAYPAKQGYMSFASVFLVFLRKCLD